MNSPLPRATWRRRAPIVGLLVPLLLAPVLLARMVSAQPPDPKATAADDPQAANQAVDSATVEQESADIEYLTRGPLHEAFAEPYLPDPTPNIVVATQPPEPIEEAPPEYRPDGDDVMWIPGYWAWDEEREDFLWVSGVWREVPPNQRWIPGYWEKADGGYRWISGFWTGIDVEQVEYLPPPPESVEEGPSSPAPADEYFYIPGQWVYQADDYQWQPGFWTQSYDNWVWVPAQYIWTPRGVVYRQGYWDYNIAYRGVVFTPVYYRQPVYRTAQYVYRPRYIVDTGLGLFVNLFVRPNYHHYYFGDYYGTQYSNVYYPWVTRYQQAAYYDPFYAYYRYRPAQTTNVLSWVSTQFEVFQRNEQFRPPRTIQAQRQFVQANQNANLDATTLRIAAIGDSLDNVVNQRDMPLRFRQIDGDEVQRIRDSNTPFRDLVQSRRRLESASDAAGRNARLDREDRIDADADADADLKPDADVDADARADARANARDRGRLELPRLERANRDRANPLDAAERAADPDNPLDTAERALDRASERARDSGERGRDAIDPTERPARDAAASGREAAGDARRDAMRPARPEDFPRLPSRADIRRELPGLPRPEGARPERGGRPDNPGRRGNANPGNANPGNAPAKPGRGNARPRGDANPSPAAVNPGNGRGAARGAAKQAAEGAASSAKKATEAAGDRKGK